MITLLGLKVAVFAALLAWWWERDRVDFRPVLSPPPWRLFLPVALLLVAAVAAAFSAFWAAIGLGIVGLRLLSSYPLRRWRLSPVGIEAGAGFGMRWDEVANLRGRCGSIELVAFDGTRLLLPRDLDGMVTFSRIAQIALPATVLRNPRVQGVLAELESGSRRCGTQELPPPRGERCPIAI